MNRPFAALLFFLATSLFAAEPSRLRPRSRSRRKRRPASGGGDFATIGDVSVDWKANTRANVTLYLARANGNGVVRSIFTGTRASFIYAELLRRF